MKLLMTGLVSLGLIATSVGQVNSQTSTTGSSQTSVNASQSGANVNTNNSANANQDVKAGKKANANASGSASQNASANTSSGDLQIPSGTKVPAVLDKSIDSRKCKQGDEVVAKTTSDVVSDGKIIIPKNSKLIGHVTEASATANGQSDSKLGIVFDKAMLRNGATVPMQARIQALAAPVVSTASSMSDDSTMSTPMGGGAAGSSGAASGRSGGVGSTVGGVTNTVGSTAGAVGSTAGNLAGSAGSTVGSTAGVAGQTVGGATSASGALSGNSTGVIGLKNLQLNSEASNASNGSVFTSSGKNVKLDSGSRMVLDVVGSSQ